MPRSSVRFCLGSHFGLLGRAPLGHSRAARVQRDAAPLRAFEDVARPLPSRLERRVALALALRHRLPYGALGVEDAVEGTGDRGVGDRVLVRSACSHRAQHSRSARTASIRTNADLFIMSAMHVVERCLPYTVEQLFDVAADIERYPEFVPGWVAVHVWERGPGYCRAENDIELAPLRLKFTADARLERPRRIVVTSCEAPFRRFRLIWAFESREGGALARLSAEVDLRAGLLRPLVDQLMRGVATDVIRAFEARANELYGACTPGDVS